MLVPKAIEEIDYDSLKNDIVEHLKEIRDIDIVFLESDTFSLIVEAFIYREMLLRARINDALRASYIWTATSSDLDAIAALYGVSRLEDEEDDRLRERCILSLYAQSTAGSKKSYIFWTKSVSNNIKEVEILNPTAGVVEVVYHSDNDYTTEISNICSGDDVIPLCDTVIVTKATIVNANIELAIEILSDFNIIDIRNAIKESFGNLSLGIGADLPLSKIYDTAHVEGVYKVTTNAIDVIANEREVIQPNIIFI
ncbi:putative Baseplate J family protein [Sulfurovum sp. enrichment culture clone C5]|uniref:Putative Baseplate J family protein n=1 Tax=Sulfurovum sp. enrichment culture clone C5 TaxID=497650 RepID=A0A0S4XLP9_9BACT|nr:putative Baseplate J family protein [Sulfurovum sp. enrichment culture clone C5]